MNNFNNSLQGNGLTFNNGQNENKQQQQAESNEIDLFAAPLKLGSGGFGSEQGAFKGVARGAAPVMFDSSMGLSQISGPSPMGAKQQQTVINTQFMIADNSNYGLDSAPLSFGNPMQIKGSKPVLEVLPNADNDNDFSEFKAEPMIFIPSKCGPKGLEATPAIYNEYQSIVVDETPKECLAKFELILNAFSNDICYKVDDINHVINGQVFIGHFAIFFKISIWKETANSNSSRFECRRMKGDSMKFNEFWNEIQSIIYSQFTNAKGPNRANSLQSDDDDFESSSFGSLPSMDYDFNLDDMDMPNDGMSGLNDDDLDQIVSELQEESPYVVMSLAMLLDTFKAQTKFIQIILNHAQFIESVLNKALKHNDIALVRAALITLERVCESNEGAQMLVALSCLDRVVPLLGSHNELIQKYAVRLMAKLTSVPSWTFANNKTKKYAKISVAECEKKWSKCRFATTDFIESTMFESINAALIKAN